MSDLQCPATLLILGSTGWPTALLEAAHVSCVYADPARADAAADLASQLGVACRVLPALRSGDDGLPERESVESIADQHRGETVALLPAPAASVDPAADDPALAHATSWELRVDADGWALHRWPAG